MNPPAVRLVSGKAHAMQAEGTEGRTLFPSLEFSHWPPFETLVESSMVGSRAADPHPHAQQEIVNYVVSGTLLVYDADRHCTEVPAGSVSLLSTARPQIHDVNPKPGTTAHWISLVLHLPRGTAEPKHSYQTAPATPVPNLPPSLEELSIVGERGPVRSVLELEMRDVRSHEPREIELPVGEHRTALLYVLEGHSRAEERDLPAGSGLLAEGLPKISAVASRASRFIFASVTRNTEHEEA